MFWKLIIVNTILITHNCYVSNYSSYNIKTNILFNSQISCDQVEEKNKFIQSKEFEKYGDRSLALSSTMEKIQNKKPDSYLCNLRIKYINTKDNKESVIVEGFYER
jgi:hypothetical protein